MKLDTVGEFGLIDLIRIPDFAPEQLILGIGDDCAVLPFDERQYQLVSCDLLVEDIHFVRSRISPRQLGYKAVAVNLSDVAAMGGTPVHILLSVALPPDYTVEEWQEFYTGVEEICRKYRVNVIGGDTTASKDKLTINVTVLGLVEKQHLHLRSAAQPGDAVFVTGALGGSRAGLELILNDITGFQAEDEAHLLQCHCQPEPCCHEIAALNQLAGKALHALNDISDGLLSECQEIAQASGVAVILQPQKVPVDASCQRLAAQQGTDALKWALTGGEDYQLVGTMAADEAESICARYRQETGKAITIIGWVEAGSGVAFDTGKGRIPAQRSGYNHFASSGEVDPGIIADDQTARSENKDGALQNEALRKNETLRQYAALAERQLQLAAKQEEAQRIYRHDLQNHLACLKGLLECGQRDAAIAYLKQMEQALPKPVTVDYSSRTVVNLLLNQKKQLADARALDLQFSCENVQMLDFMSDYDLCTLLGNLLDNGLEHSASGQDAYLYLDILADDAGQVMVRMENSCEKVPVIEEGRLVSQKPDGALHGKGMGQIRRVTAQYGGHFSWQYDGAQQRFITLCVFPA